MDINLIWLLSMVMVALLRCWLCYDAARGTAPKSRIAMRFECVAYRLVCFSEAVNCLLKAIEIYTDMVIDKRFTYLYICINVISSHCIGYKTTELFRLG